MRALVSKLRKRLKGSKGKSKGPLNMQSGVAGGRAYKEKMQQMQETFKNAPTVYVGVHSTAGTYENGLHTATIAAINEYGSGDGVIPERSFLRAGVRLSKPMILKLYGKRLPEVLGGKVSMKHVQSEVGELTVGFIVERISDGIDPANRPYTIAKKKSSTPLIDTGHLRQSITYVVSEEKAESE